MSAEEYEEEEGEDEVDEEAFARREAERAEE
jgi:hypothetical protein